MPTPDSLALYILDCKCRCGHSWTHSYPVLIGNGCFGGTPAPQEEYKFQVTRLLRVLRHFCHCHRCAPLGLGIGWETAPLALALPKPKFDPDKGIF